VTGSAARPRRWWRYLLIAGGAALATLLLALWFTTTTTFQAYVRRRMVAEIDRITGGRAEVGSFHVVPFRLQVEVRDITVHGTEAPGDIPLAHADHLIAQLKVNSFLRTDFGFHSLSVDHPVIHVAVAADGTTNVPAPKVKLPTLDKTAVDQLFALSINHLSVKNGEMRWADQKIPLDFTVEGAGLQMDYSYLRGRYESRLEIGKVDSMFEGFRPFSSMTTIDFSLGPTFVDIKSLQLTSGRSHLRASGRIADFRNPRADGQYDAYLDLTAIAAITRRQDLREGSAEVKGSGHWSLNDFATNGTLAAHDLNWQDDQFVIRKAGATTDYSVTDQQIKLSKLQTRLFGGSASGEAQIDNWLHSIPPPQAGKAAKGGQDLPVIGVFHPPAKKGAVKPKGPGVLVGTVRIRVRDFSAGDVAAALSTPAHTLGHFRPAGVIAGSVDAAWKGSVSAAEVTFDLNISPPPHPAAGELPLTAQIQGKYNAGPETIELARFNMSTPASRVQAAGTLSASSTVRLSVSTSNLGEWQPLVAALGGPVQLPFQVDGGAAFTGVAGGTLSSPTLGGTLTAQDFEFALPATSRTPEQQVHWDSLAASIQFSSRELVLRGGSLRRGDTSADFDLTALLQKGQFTENTPYTARVNLHHVDVASTAALAGFEYPVSGTADVTAQISGTRADPRVQGHIRATNAAAFQESIESFDADLAIAGGETSLNNIQLTHQDAAITGSAAYTPATRSFRLDLTGTNFDIARIRQIHLEQLLIEGRSDFTLKGSGTLDAPALQADVHVRDLSLDHEPSGGLYLEAVTREGNLHVTGHSDLLHGTLGIDGNVQMSGDYPANITAKIDQVDLDALWRAYLGRGQLTGHSSTAGTVVMKGPLRYPKQWTLDGDLSNVAIEFEYAKTHNDGPVRLTYNDETIHIAPVHMIGDGTDVTGHGAIGFGGKQDLDLAADGQIDLRLLAMLDPNITASGMTTVHMTVGGSLHQPMPQGTIAVKGGAVNYSGLPSGLSEMSGSLSFTQNRMHIDSLTSRSGGGTLEVKGDVTNFNHQLNFNLTATGKEVRLRYPPGVSSTADGELRWVGTRSASLVSGDILVTKLAVTPGFDFGSYLERSRQSAAITAANSPLYNVKLDVAVRTAPELQMKTAVARLSGDADLRVRGSLASPSVLGRADILEGDATFNGIKFRLERGDITFANPVAIEPQVNLQATTHVRNYDLDVTVTGTPDRLTVNYRSEPPLPKSDIIALLALGRTSEESEQLQQQSGQTPFTDEATALIINQAINATVSSRLQKLFGVSRIKIDPQGLTTETNPTARGPQVTIEQQFANNITLTYSTNVSQSSQQIIQGEYYFTRNVSAVGTRDQNGVVSFDVRIRRRKK
jgi:translocation and assembly module TamB